jgi:hypothetical protein
MSSPADPAPDPTKPLASYLLRVRAAPAGPRYELMNLRDGVRHVFRDARAVAAFLQTDGATSAPAQPPRSER